MSEEQTGLAAILGGFAQFSDGVEGLPAQITDARHVVTRESVTVELPHVNGELPGDVANVDFWVDFQQLQLAPSEDLLLSRYKPENDKDFELFKAAVKVLGEAVPSLTVLPAHQNITLQGKSVPLYLVYDDPPLYYAQIALGWARIKVHFPVKPDPGAVLLESLSRHGQLHREPSFRERCATARRLKEHYGYTLDEIATHESRNREDKSKPSVQAVHYEILVACLPEGVQDRLEEQSILYTHARDIAEAFAGDDGMCESLAELAAQGGRMRVDTLQMHIRRLKAGLEHLERDEDGDLQIINHDQAITLVTDGRGRGDIAPYERTMIARATLIRREAAKFQIALVPAGAPEKIAVSSRSLDELSEWITSRRANTTVRDLEAVLLGFLEAIRLEARKQGLVNNQGALTQMITTTATTDKDKET